VVVSCPLVDLPAALRALIADQDAQSVEVREAGRHLSAQTA